MTSRPVKKDIQQRPVFVPGAVYRVSQQKTWRRKFHSAALVAAVVLDEILWWLREGLWHVPETLLRARNRKTIRIHPDKQCPALDTYVHENHQSYLSRCLQPAKDDTAKDTSIPDTPVVLYIHGGAWGAGQSFHYSQLAHSIVSKTKATVLILSYRLYPMANMDDQTDDVHHALLKARETFPNRKLVVLAHSSGAHTTALTFLRHAKKSPDAAPLADVAIFTAGPFHLMHHFMYESQRGVADVSPMLPAAKAEEDHTHFFNYSPSVIAEHFEGALKEIDLPPHPTALEGDLAASNVPLQDVKQIETGISFPRMYILTSTCDTVVPIYSSLRFAASLRKIGLNTRLLVYDFESHADFVTDWFEGTRSRDKSGMFDFEKGDAERRIDCVRSLGGDAQAELARDEERNFGPSAYVRDVLRILKALERKEKEA